MKRSERMKIVRSVAEHEEKEVCRAMGESQKRFEEELGRLEDLKEYRQLYMGQSAQGRGQCAFQWQDNYNFMSRLDNAVAAQESVVTDGNVERELHRKRWMIKRQRLEALSRIVDKYSGAEFEELSRQQRKLEDAQPLVGSAFKTDLDS